MNEDEILENESIVTDSRSKFTSQSADTNANNGLRGKLTEDQLDERTRFHAKRQTYGHPNIAAIIKTWKNQGVTMSVNSEYEWARNNQARIDVEITRLEESGEMPIVSVPNSTITASLASGARDMLDTIKMNKKTQIVIQKEIAEMSEIYKMIGAPNKEAYWSSKDDQREEWDKRINHLLKIKDSHVNTFKELSKATADQGRVLVEMMKTVSELNKSGEVMDKILQQKVKDAIKDKGLKLQERKDLSDFDPLAEPDYDNT
jgi:transcription elongation GreA/GreB family factor